MTILAQLGNFLSNQYIKITLFSRTYNLGYCDYMKHVPYLILIRI